MISLFFGILFAAITLLAIGLQRTYNHYPVKELMRRARNGDPLARMLYQPVSYGMSLQVLLGLIVLLSAALSFVLLSRTLEAWFAVFVIATLLWLGFLWLPSASLTSYSMRIAMTLTPLIDRLLSFLHPVLRRIADFLQRHRHVSLKTGLYEKEDIVALLDRQQGVPENRIAEAEIDLLRHALTFGDKLVRDALIPKRAVHSVSAHDDIGPKLMDELFQSGHSRFPVFDAETDQIVGTLFMRDLVQRQKRGKVTSVMHPDVFYVHEDFTLFEALQAFIKTKHHLFVVVNSFEEMVGIITIEDIIEQVIGKQIVDEFDTYDNIRAVAARKAGEEHAARQKAAQEPTEVVE